MHAALCKGRRGWVGGQVSAALPCAPDTPPVVVQVFAALRSLHMP
jgi:hypothetical protein